MKEVMIFLKDINDVKEFLSITEDIDNCDFDIIQGKYSIDAKSIIGLLNIDISMPLRLQIHCKDEYKIPSIIEKISKFIKK